jgi:DNA-dependent RNA polymerase auxiliary subunit epsilon
MVKPKNYKGIEFITLSDLPSDQRDLLEKTSHAIEFIKILIDGNILKAASSISIM